MGPGVPGPGHRAFDFNTGRRRELRPRRRLHREPEPADRGALLRFARENCDCLIIGINSDSSVKRLGKGDDRPINSQCDRVSVVEAFEMVDATIIFDSDTPLELIKEIQPDVLIKGGDYTIETVVGSSIVLEYGGSVLLAPMVHGKSSTGIITQVRGDAS